MKFTEFFTIVKSDLLSSEFTDLEVTDLGSEIIVSGKDTIRLAASLLKIFRRADSSIKLTGDSEFIKFCSGDTVVAIIDDQTCTIKDFNE